MAQVKTVDDASMAVGGWACPTEEMPGGDDGCAIMAMEFEDGRIVDDGVGGIQHEMVRGRKQHLLEAGHC